jgi:hypothetical protein
MISNIIFLPLVFQLLQQYLKHRFTFAGELSIMLSTRLVSTDDADQILSVVRPILDVADASLRYRRSRRRRRWWRRHSVVVVRHPDERHLVLAVRQQTHAHGPGSSCHGGGDAVG